MRHLKRPGQWLFTLTAGVSLLLCIIAAAMWVRSYAWSDAIYWRVGNDVCGAGSRGGQVRLHYIPGMAVVGGTGVRSFQTDDPLNVGDHFVFRITKNSFGVGGVDQPTRMFITHVLTIPHWSAVAVLGMLPTLWIWRWLRQRRAAMKGMCLKCGYDLRATPERCPECGTTPEVAKGVAT